MEAHEVFSALACRWRVRIVEILGKGELCQCELVKILPIDETTLSRHIAVLKNVGIIVSRRDGKKNILGLKDPTVLKLIELAKVLGGEKP